MKRGWADETFSPPVWAGGGAEKVSQPAHCRLVSGPDASRADVATRCPMVTGSPPEERGLGGEAEGGPARGSRAALHAPGDPGPPTPSCPFQRPRRSPLVFSLFDSRKKLAPRRRPSTPRCCAFSPKSCTAGGPCDAPSRRPTRAAPGSWPWLISGG